MSYIEVSEDSDVVFIDCIRSRVKKKIEEKRRKVTMSTEVYGETIRCETQVKQRRRKAPVLDRRERLDALIRSIAVPVRRIVPCCMRKHCNRTEIKRIHRTCTRQKRRRRKRSPSYNRPTKTIHTRNTLSMYESISSDSLYSSDNELEELIRSTRKRMQNQLPGNPTTVLKASSPEGFDLDSTFDLTSIHSLDTVVINKVKDCCEFSPILSQSSSETFKIEPNQMDIYSPSMNIVEEYYHFDNYEYY